MKADVTTDSKTRKGTKGVAAAERLISGYNSSAQIDTDPIRLTSFDDDSIGSPALPCSRNDALVDEGSAAPKPCLSPVEMRTRTAAGGIRLVATFFTAIQYRLSFSDRFLLGLSERPTNVPAG